jgi:hypothetical protein
MSSSFWAVTGRSGAGGSAPRSFMPGIESYLLSGIIPLDDQANGYLGLSALRFHRGVGPSDGELPRRWTQTSMPIQLCAIKTHSRAGLYVRWSKA